MNALPKLNFLLCLIAASAHAATMKEAPNGMYIFPSGFLSATNQAFSSAGTAISNANCDGVRWLLRWSDVEATPDTYTWQYLDDAVAWAAANNKKCGISINAGTDCPAWLYAAPYSAQSYTLQDTVVFGSTGTTVPVPGDAVFMTRWQKFVTDFGARYDSNPAVSYVIIYGIGNHDEWNIADGFNDTAALGNTLEKVNAWKSSSKQIIDFYMSAFPSTTVMGLPVPPFNPSNAAEDPATSMREVSAYAGEAGGITPRRADMIAIPAPTPCPTPTPISADLKVTVNDSKTAIVAGARDTYSINVINVGPGAVGGASITDAFPTLFTNVSYTATQLGGAFGFSESGAGNINDTVLMPSGSKITYTAKGKVNPSATGTISNTARVTPPAGVNDPDPGNNTATDTDSVTVKADLKVTVADGRTAAVPGTKNTYTIVVTNAGPSNASGAVVQDIFAATFTGVTFTATETGGATGFSANGSGNINDTVNMPAASKVTYRATGTISASATGSISNTATVTTPNGVTDPNTVNNPS